MCVVWALALRGKQPDPPSPLCCAHATDTTSHRLGWTPARLGAAMGRALRHEHPSTRVGRQRWFPAPHTASPPHPPPAPPTHK